MLWSKLFGRRARRRDASGASAWELAPFEELLAAARLLVATLPPTRATGRLARRQVADEAELLELLRTVRIEVCKEFSGLASYDASGVHAILLVLRQRQVRRMAAVGARRPVGPFR